MPNWILRVVPVVLLALVLGEYLAPPKPNSERALISALSHELRFTYHECIPLGWKPVPAAGTYYPGYTASVQNYAEWLDALWMGRIRASELRSRDAADVQDVLHRLAAHGLIAEGKDGGAFTYSLTFRALPYYYASSVFNDNRDSLTYLCYSTIVPQRILWLHRIPAGKDDGSSGEWYDAEFSWKPSAPPAWAGDPFLQSHSVVLAPLTSPTTARVSYMNGEWRVANIYDRGWMLPALSSALRSDRDPALP